MPIFFVIVNPKRGPAAGLSLGPRERISTKNEGVDARLPPRTARNSARALRVGKTGISASSLFRCRSASRAKRKGACGPSSDGGREPSGHRRSAYACETRGGACERAGSVDKCASRTSPSQVSRPAPRVAGWRNPFRFRWLETPMRLGKPRERRGSPEVRGVIMGGRRQVNERPFPCNQRLPAKSVV